MKPIESIIQSFTARQYMLFQSFVQVPTGRKNEQELALLRAMRKGDAALQNWVERRYGKEGSSRAAYHAQRQRLATKVENYLAIELASEYEQNERNMLKTLHAARRLFVEGQFEWGKRLLRRAEHLSEQLNDPLWQSLLFREKLKWLSGESLELLPEFEDEKVDLSRRIDLDQRMGLAEAELYHIIKRFKSGLELNSILQSSRKVLTKYGLDVSQLSEVVMVHRLAVMVRRVMNAEKRYEALLNFLEVQSDRIKELGGFDSHHLNMEVELDYMLAHARYRNRYFQEALEVLAEVYLKLNRLSQQQEYRWFTPCVLLEAACRSFSGKNQVAIQLLESNLSHPAFVQHPKERLNLMLNLGVYHFQQNGFYRSKELLENFGHSDAWVKEQLGTEWLLKWKMIRIINRIELGDVDWAKKQVVMLQADYEEFYQLRAYRRVEVFLRFIETYMQDPQGFRSPRTLHALEKEFVQGKNTEEDLQAMAYYAWLKSKATGEKYYSLLLQMVGNVK